MMLNRLLIVAAASLGLACTPAGTTVKAPEPRPTVGQDAFRVVQLCRVAAASSDGIRRVTLHAPAPSELPLVAILRRGSGPDAPEVWRGEGTTESIEINLTAAKGGDLVLTVLAPRTPLPAKLPWVGAHRTVDGLPCDPRIISPTCNPDPPPPCPPDFR